MQMETHIHLTPHTQLHYETDLQNVGRRTKDSFHVPATGKEGRPRYLSKKGEEESYCVCVPPRADYSLTPRTRDGKSP